MAFATRYRIEAEPFLDGLYGYRVDIEQDGYGGSVNDITPAKSYVQPIFGTQGRVPTDGPFKPSSVRFSALDTDLLETIFDTGPRTFRVSVYRSTNTSSFPSDPWWRGYVVDDFYEDNPDAPLQTVELEATWAVQSLQNDAFDDTFSGGLADLSILQAIFGCLNTIGLDLPFEVSQKWHPFFSSNKLADATQTWSKIFYDEDNWRSDREEPSNAWLSQYDVLQDILTRFECQLEISDGAWRITQRSGLARTDIGGAAGSADVWTYDSAGTLETSPSQPTTDDFTVDIDSTVSTGELVPDRREFIQRVQEVRAVHDFRDQESIILNGSFETAGSTAAEALYWQGTGYERDELLDISTNTDTGYTNKYGARIDGGSSAGLAMQQSGLVRLNGGPDKNAIFKVNHITEEDADGIQTRPQILWEFDGYYLQEFSEEVATDIEDGEEVAVPIFDLGDGISGYQEGVPVLAEGQEIQFSGGGRMTLSRVARLGDEFLFGELEPPDSAAASDPAVTSGETFNFWTWTTTSNQIELPAAVSQWDTWQARAFLIAANGVNLQAEPGSSAPFQFQVYQPVTSGSGTTNYAGIDQVEVRPQQGDALLGETIAITRTDTQGQNLSFTSRLGDGPTETNEGRLRVEDGANNVDEVSGEWQAGFYNTGDSSSDTGINELAATERLRQYRSSLTRRRFVVYPRDSSEVIDPHRVIDYGGTLYSIEYAEYRDAYNGTLVLEGVELVDSGTSSVDITFSQTSQQTGGGSNTVVSGSASTGGGSGVLSLDSATGDIATETGVLSVTSGALQIDSGGVGNAKLTNDSVTVTAGNQLTGGGSVALGSSVTLDVDDGPGSGLDADTLDGIDSTGFLQSIEVSGGGSGPFALDDGEDIQFSAGSGLNVSVTNTAGGVGVTFSRVSGSIEPHKLSDHSDAIFGDPNVAGQGAMVVADGSNWDDLTVGTDDSILIADSTAANGLGVKWGTTAPNADTLDGQDGSYYTDAGNLDAGTVPSARLSGTYDIDISGNADTLDGQDASAFMETVDVSGGGNTFTLIDGEALQFTGGNGISISTTDTAGGVGVTIDVTSGSVEPHTLSEHTDAIFGSPATQGTGALIASDGSDWDALSLGTDGNVLIADSGNANGLGVAWDTTVPNADKLDSQEGAYYTDASNLNAGTVPTARLSGTYNINISGDADTVDGQDASAFMESIGVSGGGGGPFNLIDGEDLQFSAGSGLEVSVTDTAGGVGVEFSRLGGSVEPHSLSEHDDASFGSPVTQGTGTLISSDGSNWNAVAVGTDGQILTADSGAGTGVSWGNTAPNADTLDSQDGSYYTDASNLDAGTVPTARLSGTYNIDISGDADTLDGQDASAFMESLDVSGGGNTFTLIDAEALQFTSGIGITISLTDTAGGVGVDISRVSGSVEPHSLSGHDDASMGSPVTQGAGTLISSDGSNWESVSVGTDGQVLQADSGAATGVSWTTQVSDSAQLGGVSAFSYARTDTASERFTGQLHVDGNVGIGTTSPSEKLDVDGSIFLSDRIRFTSTGQTRIQYDTNKTGSEFYIQREASISETAITIKGTDVGIGTTTPSAKLQVNGNFVVNTDGLFRIDNNGSLLFDNTSGEGNALFKMDYGNYFEVQSSGGNPVLTAWSGDNIYSQRVGIGTPSPSSKLDVNGNIEGDAFIGKGTNLSGQIDPNHREVFHAYGPTSDYTITIQDGNGRVHHYWNVDTDGNSTQKHAVSGEGASWLRLNGGEISLNTAGSGTAGDTISWNTAHLNSGGDWIVDGEVEAFDSSDRRKKDHLTPIENPLDILRDVKGYSFQWNANERDRKVGKWSYGVVAQEIQRHLPHAVRENADGYLAVQGSQLHGFHVAVDRSQQAEIERLKRRVQKLENKLERLS